MGVSRMYQDVLREVKVVFLNNLPPMFITQRLLNFLLLYRDRRTCCTSPLL